jgi:hypothetical protein
LSKKRQIVLKLFSILSITFFTLGASQVLGDESEAVSSVTQAENSLDSAYLSLLETERAGGDISELVKVLNTAIEYYSKAEMALKKGEYNEADLLATKAVKASNVVLEANLGLVSVTKYVEGAALRNQLYLTLGAVIFIIPLSFLSWRRFKEYYIENIKKMRPEVVIDEP